jgi:hypothetical protein
VAQLRAGRLALERFPDPGRVARAFLQRLVQVRRVFLDAFGRQQRLMGIHGGLDQRRPVAGNGRIQRRGHIVR